MRRFEKYAIFAVLIQLAIPIVAKAVDVNYYGAAQEVSGSMAKLTNGSLNFLVDVGAHYNEHPDGGIQRNTLTPPTIELDFGFDPASIHCVFLTHAHLDHTGRLPQLVREGFVGKIFTTAATKSILEVMLEMQLRYEKQRIRNWNWSEYSNKGKGYIKAHWNSECQWRRKISRHNLKGFIGSLYQLQKDHESQSIDVSPCKVCARIELDPILSKIVEVKYNTPVFPAQGVHVTFLDAKHIPGSASILFKFETSNGEHRSCIFSGDLGSDMSRFLNEPAIAPTVDAIFVEGTYGDHSRNFEHEDEYLKFRHDIAKSIEEGKIVWIPSFALDRSQRIMYELRVAMQDGVLPASTQIYLPSPTARKVTELYLDNDTWNDAEIELRLNQIYTLTSNEYLDPEEFDPAPGSILITTSGMMDSAFSVGLIDKLLERSEVIIAFVGYQSPFTYGGQIKEGSPTVEKDGKTIQKKAEHRSYACFSGHGDADDIDRWLENNIHTDIYLVHGDKESLASRRRDLMDKGFKNVTIVERIATYPLD